MKTKIKNCNIDLLEKQKCELIDEIVYGNNADKFRIFDIEACCGKSRTTEQALATMVEKTDRSAILVKINIKDCREAVRNINSLTGEEVAITYNNEDVSQSERRIFQKRLSHYRIVVITHQKYRVLSVDKAQRNIFIKGREVLVIDEFISEIEKISLTIKDINTYKWLLQRRPSIYQKFVSLMKEPENYLLSSNNSQRYIGRFESKRPVADFNELIRLIKKNINSEDLSSYVKEGLRLRISNINELNTDLLTKITSVNQLCFRIEQLKEFYTNYGIFDKGILYTTDKRYKNWILQNNILLDASGELQIAYELDMSRYQLLHLDKVLDHKKWKLINIKVNSTSVSKERLTNFYEVVNKHIQKYQDNILVIGNKKEVTNEVNATNKGYFGNLTGSNEWSAIPHVAIIQTHNLNDIDYILTYLHYSRDYINNETNLKTRNTGRKGLTKYGFANPVLEKIRNYWISSETYQAIKRVNRNMRSDTDVLIFMNNDEVIQLLKKQLKNCTVEELYVDENELGYEYTKQDNYVDNLQKDSHANKFLSLLSEIEKGEHRELEYKEGVYQKKVLREYLGISKAAYFNHKVLSKERVIEYCKARNIELSGKYVKMIS